MWYFEIRDPRWGVHRGRRIMFDELIELIGMMLRFSILSTYLSQDDNDYDWLHEYDDFDEEYDESEDIDRYVDENELSELTITIYENGHEEENIFSKVQGNWFVKQNNIDTSELQEKLINCILSELYAELDSLNSIYNKYRKV